MDDDKKDKSKDIASQNRSKKDSTENEYGLTKSELNRLGSAYQAASAININSALSAYKEAASRIGKTYQALNDVNINSALSAIRERGNLIGTAYKSLNEININSALSAYSEASKQIGRAYQALNEDKIVSALDAYKDRIQHFSSIFDSINEQRSTIWSVLEERGNVIGEVYKRSFTENNIVSTLSAYRESLERINRVYQSLNEQSLAESGEAFKPATINKIIVKAVKELNEAVPKDANKQYSDAINDLMVNLPDISGKESTRAVVEFACKLPARTGWIFWLLLLYVIFPSIKAILEDTAVGLVSDNLKPMIKAYVCDHSKVTNKIISALICSSPEGMLSSNRFVNAEHLHVRSSPNAKGEIIDVLPRFEPVTLIRKNENFSWSLIRYKNEDGEMIEGWVFSRYLYKPKQ